MSDQVRSISFTVFGTAQPKGSTRAIPFRDRRTGRLRVNVMSDNKHLASWERLVRFEAQTILRQQGHPSDVPFFEGKTPVAIRLRFALPRPKSVKAKARPFHVVKPDLDKLVRAAVDGLIGVMFDDDGQVCKFHDPEKFYADGRPFAEITVMEHRA